MKRKPRCVEMRGKRERGKRRGKKGSVRRGNTGKTKK